MFFMALKIDIIIVILALYDKVQVPGQVQESNKI